MLEVIIAGFSIGILGGFHCVGMCGPLALAIPIHHLSTFQRTVSILLYNLGRALSYAAMGAVFGLLGQSFALFKMQQALSISAGILILAILLMNRFGKDGIGFIGKYSQMVQQKLSSFLKSEKKTISFLYIGLVNGFLPCGLVYIAIAASIAAGSVFNSSLLMFAFGLGTIPIMALTMVFGKFISFNIRKKLNFISPYIIGCIAVLLILRGLNLGIPYISPVHEEEKVSCCHAE